MDDTDENEEESGDKMPEVSPDARWDRDESL